MTTSYAQARAEDKQDLALTMRNQLLTELSQAREALSLSKSELADRIGRNRSTVQRAESGDVSISLTSFCEIAAGLGLTPRLVQDEGQHDPHVAQVLPQDMVHRGLHHNRTRFDLGDRDRQREAAISKSWEAVNATELGFSPVMTDLVPNFTQPQATAVATALQWLGSENGFDFLERALAAAGYDIVDNRASKSARKTRW